jgi:hypothetical protein
VAQACACHDGERHCADGPTVQPCWAPEGRTKPGATIPRLNRKNHLVQKRRRRATPEPMVRQWCDIGPARQPHGGRQPARAADAAISDASGPAISTLRPTRLRQGRRRRNVRRGAGCNPGGWRTSQLRVKLGMLRPPIKVISNTMTPMTKPHAEAAPSVRHRLPMKNANVASCNDLARDDTSQAPHLFEPSKDCNWPAG